ncbi:MULTISPECIES: hypothetical protein [unclassified Acinetobacter]|uniref:hypothetical protein n=1 Tax=unclassified Acinetobacter TaxID=196816 RepID=UPI0015D1E54B|nr:MULTISPECIES: hypothetical protein [unclassified Acinetobacter]
MDFSSVVSLKKHFNADSDQKLAEALAKIGILRTGARQTVYLWGGKVPQHIQDALELRQYRMNDKQRTEKAS